MFLTIFAPQAGASRSEFRSVDASAAVDSLYFAHHPLASLALAESLLIERNDADLRWRAARAAIAVGMLAETAGERRLLYDRALLHARDGVALQAAGVETRYWLAAAAGRRAHRDDPVYSARLAIEVHEIATTILAEDSSHAGAHHVLGVLHAEVLRVPALARFVASRVLRVDLVSRANQRDAERHLRRAVALEGESIPFLADLAVFLLRTGRIAEADAVIGDLFSAPMRNPTDDAARAEVLRLRRESGHPVALRRRLEHAAHEVRVAP